MSARAQELLEQAKTLSEDERAEIADGLLATLPGEEIELAWVEEVERRAREAHAGSSETVPLSEFLAHVDAQPGR